MMTPINYRDLCTEWKHDSLPLTLWIHNQHNTGLHMLAIAQLERLPDGFPRAWKNLFSIAHAYVLDYEWTGEQSHPLVDYLATRDKYDFLKTINEFLALDWQDAFILALAYDSVHPATTQETESEGTTDE